MTTLALAPELDALPAIGLDELNATASLLTRADRKYILPAEELNGILTALPIGSRALEVHGERTPAYDTVYLDTVDLDAYFATARRRPRRRPGAVGLGQRPGRAQPDPPLRRVRGTGLSHRGSASRHQEMRTPGRQGAGALR